MNSQLKTIGQAAKEAGLTPFVIRAWEKRYEVTNPIRTAGNRRLYTEDDVEKLCLLAKLTDQGLSIGQLAGRSMDDLNVLLQRMRRPVVGEFQVPQQAGADPGELVKSAIEIVQQLDMGRLLQTLNQANVGLTKPQLIHQFITPLMHEIGDRWESGEMRVAHEHMASAAVRMFLSNLLMSQRPPENAPMLIACTPPGQDHEVGALLAGLTAAMAGWRVCYLGPDLPPEEIAAGAIQANAEAVALSLSFPVRDLTDFEMLKQLLPSIPVYIGGRAVEPVKDRLEGIGFTVIDDLSAMQKMLY